MVLWLYGEKDFVKPFVIRIERQGLIRPHCRATSSMCTIRMFAPQKKLHPSVAKARI
jgi:hypothetical protein